MRKRWYIGHGSPRYAGAMVVFGSEQDGPPNRWTNEYTAVTGPFKTRKAAVCAGLHGRDHYYVSTTYIPCAECKERKAHHGHRHLQLLLAHSDPLGSWAGRRVLSRPRVGDGRHGRVTASSFGSLIVKYTVHILRANGYELDRAKCASMTDAMAFGYAALGPWADRYPGARIFEVRDINTRELLREICPD